MTLRRRTLLAGAGALAATPFLPRAALAARDPLMPLWEAWRARHLTSDGRVVDQAQGHGSHSEGQGYALRLAEAVGDADAFQRILDWTMANLAVRPDDALLAWRWLPQAGGIVEDLNNASDGDLFVAWALVRAATTFDRPDYRDLARDIAADLVRLCVRPCPAQADCLVLLPGAVGFETDGGWIVNPAYYVLQALRDVGAATDQPDLVALAADGSALISRLTRTGLPPDWIAVTERGLHRAPLKSGDFGYEAMRVPLYLTWSGQPGHAAVTQAARAYRPFLDEAGDQMPTVIDALTGDAIERSTDPGYRAVAALTACAAGAGAPTHMPAFTAEQAYYPATLHLFALIAQRETRTGCYL